MLNRSRVRLVVLDTSDSARLATDPFRSLAPALVRAQVPAVVAMQSTLPDDAARAFAKNFYQALAEGFPLDTCMTEGRKAVMSAAGLGRADWGIPVVYTRAPDGVLFDLPAPLTQTLPGTIVARPADNGAVAAVGIHALAGALLSAPPPTVVQLGAAPSPPRRRRDFRDREAEQRDLLAELRPGGGAWLYGPPGCGLSTLLTQIAANTPPGALPHGVVCVDGADEPPHLDDVLQRLFARFYSASTTMRVDPGAAQTYLGRLQALVVLDRLPLSYDELTRLVETTLPNSAALVAADGEGPGTLLDLSLGSLPRADAVALCASITRLDGARSEIAAALDRVCAALGDLPLPLLLVARVLRQQTVPIGQIAAVLEDRIAQGNNHSALALAARLSIEGLNEQERAVLAAVVVGKPHAHIETLAGSSGLPAPALRTMLQRLIGLGLVQGNEDRYEVATPSLRRTLEELLPPERERSRAAAFLAGAAGLRAGDLAWIERERGNLMQAIETLLAEGRAAEAGALAKSVQPAMVLHGLWGSWGDVIDGATAAARQSGDGALRAWALHERGTRAGLLGDRASAADALNQALELRRRMGDQAGAAATRRNMTYLELFPPVPPTTSGEGWPLRPALLAAGAGIIALLAILWIAGSLFFGDQAPVAVANARPNSGDAPLAVTFDAGGSSTADGAPLLFIWDFGDGTTAETTSPITTHTYDRPGTYQATLRVRDGDGRTSTEPALLQIDVGSIVVTPTDTPTSQPPTLTPEPALPTDTPTSTPTDTPTSTPTDTPTPTSTPTETPTPTETLTPSPPDLVVVSLEATGPATRRGRAFVEVPVRVVIANQGGTAAEPFKVSVRYTDVAGASFTVAFTVEGQADPWYPYTNEPLAGADTIAFEGVLTFLSSSLNSQVLVSALADSCDGEELTPVGCRVAESDEQNNESKPVTIDLRPSPPPIN